MNIGWCGSSNFASCLAIPLCRRPWKSTPTSMPRLRTLLTRSTVFVSTVGESIHAIDSAQSQQSVSLSCKNRREMRISTCPIHLYSSEALLSASLRSLIHIARLIPADPPIDFDTIAHFATEQLPDRHAELLAFDVPQCNIQTRQCGLS